MTIFIENTQLVYAVANTQKNNKSFNDKIHYITMILYLNYKKNKKIVLSIKNISICMQTSPNNLWLFKIYF